MTMEKHAGAGDQDRDMPMEAAIHGAAPSETSCKPMPDPAVSAGRVTTPRERARAFVILFLSMTCLGMGQTVIFAILPPLARQLGFIDFQVGAIFMVSAVAWLVMSPFWGRQSDYWGRKPVILVGLVGFVLSTILFAGLLAWGLAAAVPMILLYPALILSRTIYGVLGPGAASAAQAYVADRTSLENRTSSLAAMGSAFVLGTTFGPGMVGLLSGYGLLAPLFGVAALGAISVLAIGLLLPERTGPKPQKPTPRMQLWDPRVREPLGICILLSTAQAIPVQTVTFFFIDRFQKTPALAAEFAAQALLASSFSMLIVQLVVLPRLRWTGRRLMGVGSVLATIGFALMIAADAPNMVVVGMVFVGLGFAAARAGGVGEASLAVPPEEQGAVAGLVSATGGAGFVVAPLVAFPLYALTPSAPYGLSMALLVAVVLWLMFNRGARR